MKSYDEIASSVLERRDEYIAAKLTRMKTIRKTAVSVACVLFVALIGFGVLKLATPETTPSPDNGTTASNTVQPTVSTASTTGKVTASTAPTGKLPVINSSKRTIPKYVETVTNIAGMSQLCPPVAQTVTNTPGVPLILHLANGYWYPFDGDANAYRTQTLENFRKNKQDYDNAVRYITEKYKDNQSVKISRTKYRYTLEIMAKKSTAAEIETNYKDEQITEFMKKYSVSGIFYTDGAVYISHLSDMRYGVLFVATKDAELLDVIGNVLYPDEWAYRADFW